MSPVICPAYLPNIAYFSTISRSRNITLYIHGNYQKQTYRNRAQIYSPNGILDLSIPIIKPKNIIEKKDYNIKICYDENWQKKHWKTIKNSYSSSPFFEFYETELFPFYDQQYEYLMDYNTELIQVIMAILNLTIRITKSSNLMFQNHYEEKIILAKKSNEIDIPMYSQVFDLKHGYIKNLSILDLIFNLGPESFIFLNKVNI
tara:strand:+ start:763 stop:1371 length:609 start_codon:yes stop_codon:yes gene_type:complete